MNNDQNENIIWLKTKQIRKLGWRLISLIIIMLFLIFDLILIINYPATFIIADVKNATERLAIYYSYFTTQTNYLVLAYLFAFLFESKIKENSKLSFYILLSITIYITITMLVFWIGIITNSNERNKYGTDFYPWFKTIILDLIMPIIMILNFVLSCGHDFYDLKKHHQLYLWLILFYPCFYLVAVIVRGVLRTKQEAYPIASRYPYFFLDYQQQGIISLVGAIIGLIIVAISLQYFYLWINNKKYYKLNKKQNNPPIATHFTPIITYPYRMNH